MKPWHALSAEETQKILDAGPGEYGPNRLEDREAVRWHAMLARQFANVLILVLIVAACLSFFLGDRVDALAILAIVVLNGFLGFIQEWKAETAIKNLKKMLAPRCRVLRGGWEEEIDAENLVPGDCVLLSAGNAVPADIRLIAVTDLRADEAALTGESASVAKHTDALPEDTPVVDRRNIVFMGTHIVNGRGRGLVVATGMETEFGRIAGITGAIRETKTRLQRHLAVLGRQLGFLALAISGIVVVIGVFGGRNMMQMFMTGVSLAVAAVPEGLPAVVTIALALGVTSMARKKALLRHLQAAETLGAVSVICTDKTGTLTKNEMTVQKIWMIDAEISVGGVGYEPEGDFHKAGRAFEPQFHPGLMAFLDTGRKCSHARIERSGQEWVAHGFPTEAALVVAAEKAGLKQEHKACIVDEFSFNSTRKRMSVVEETQEGLVVHAKGAPEVMLPLCTHFLADGKRQELTQDYRRRIEAAYTGFAENGLRTLALARKDTPGSVEMTEAEAENGLTFLGIAGVIDPPRSEIPEALAMARKAGIRVIIITGDSPLTALAIAKQVGLNAERAVTSVEMKTMSDETLSRLLERDILFARTIPEDKFRIVKLLQAQGDLIAMTGDGVNDAPALKQADIGIAMGIRGTDVARGAADMVLSDDNFASIIAAVEEGRRQYANIRKFVRFMTSSNIGEVLAILINIAVGGPLILLPIQILWINLVTDGATAVSLSVERAEKGIMDEPPRRGDQPILDRMSFFLLGLFGSYIGIATFGLYQFYLSQSYALANTVAFTVMVLMANIHTLNFRNLHGPLSQIGWFSNRWLLIAIPAMMGLQVAAVHVPGLQEVLHTVPLSAGEWGVIALAALPLFAVPEVYKWRASL